MLMLTMLVIISLFMSITTFAEIRRERAIFRVHLEELGLLYLNAVQQVFVKTGGDSETSYAQLMGGNGRGMPEVSHLELYSENGEPLMSLVAAGEDSTAFDNKAVWPSDYAVPPLVRHVDDYLDVTAPISSEGRIVGYVHFRMSSSSVGSAIRQLAVSAFVQALVMIVVAVPITYFVARRFTRPIKTLTRAAESVGAGQLDVEMPPNKSQNDEIGDLNRSFSGMVEALKESRRQLERAQERNMQSARMVAVDKLANGVAHEINNPLASILGFAQLGLQKLSRVEGQTVEREEISFLERYLGFVETEARRCGLIIARMLSFTPSPQLHMNPIDINQQVEQAIKMNINQLALAGVTPELNLSEGLPKVNAEVTSLLQAFEHVLTNAVTAMPDGGTLSVSTKSVPDLVDPALTHVVVEMQDTGRGIPSDSLPRVFDPFFTTADPGQGTGLGLYLTYQIIKQHGADIDIASNENVGTTVTMTFPACEITADSEDSHVPVEWI